jgi:hypothetical protein
MSTSFIAGPRPAEQGAAGSDPDRRALRSRVKHGGERRRVDLNEAVLSITGPEEELLAIDEALERLAAADEQAAEVRPRGDRAAHASFSTTLYS